MLHSRVASLTLVPCAILAALVGLEMPGSAAFVGLEVTNVTTQYIDPYTADGQGFTLGSCLIFEMYATFNDPADNLIAVTNAEISSTYAAFYHMGDGSEVDALPFKQSAYAQSAMDTYVTIGFPYVAGAGNPDGGDPGSTPDPLKIAFDPSFDFDSFLAGNAIDDVNHIPGVGTGWGSSFVDPTNIQGVAGNYLDLKILLGRFAVTGSANDPVTLKGNLNLTYHAAGGPASIQTGMLAFQKTDKIKSVAMPAPGAISLVALAGLAGRRRRRCGF
jgi:MYXO-CTERM domain-containing protein